MGFFLLVLLNAVLFIRPSEIMPGLEAIPIYNIVITSCVLVSVPAVLRELAPGTLVKSPISACAVGLLPAVILSQLSHGDLFMARTLGVEFAKVVLYYVLLVGLLDSTARLRRFMSCLIIMIGVISVLSLLHYHGAITIESMKVMERVEENSAGEIISVQQLYGTGIFADPNDLCLILTVGIGLSLYRFDEPGSVGRWFWLVPLGLFVYTLALTKSRGGFLAMLGCVLIAFIGRFGWKKAVPIAAVVLPLMFVLFAGRQTDLSTSSGTGQQRIQLWAESLAILRRMPLFGLGASLLPDEIGHVAHNSFVHAYAELGFFGGTLFVGLYYLVAQWLIRSGRYVDEIGDPDLRRMRPYLLGAAAGYAVGMLSLSRNYVNPTFLIPALTAVYLRLVGADTGGSVPLPRLDGRLVGRLIVVSAATVVVLYVYVRVFARYG